MGRRARTFDVHGRVRRVVESGLDKVIDMGVFYEVWDDSTGNRLGEYETLADARALLRDVLSTSGPGSVCELSVLVYTPTENDGYSVTTVLEGVDFVASLIDTPKSSVHANGPGPLPGQRVERSA